MIPAEARTIAAAADRASQDEFSPRHMTAQLTVASFSGPLPPPALLEQYNQTIQNGAERIMVLVENQSAHREDLERRVVTGNVANQTRGSWFAFVIMMTAILCGSGLIYIGKDTAGLTAIITAVGGMVSVFFYSKLQQKKEREDKAEALEQRKRK